MSDDPSHRDTDDLHKPIEEAVASALEEVRTVTHRWGFDQGERTDYVIEWGHPIEVSDIDVVYVTAEPKDRDDEPPTYTYLRVTIDVLLEEA